MTGQYDALLIVSFGGPEGPDDVVPFLERVLQGKNVPRERMLEVAEHYYHFGGVSPINEQNRSLIVALEKELSEQGPKLPIYWGNRNWHPLLTDTMQQMKQDGVKRCLAFVTSVFSSFSGCRQYLEDIQRAQKQVGDGAPQVDKLRAFYNHPGFIQSMRDRVEAALKEFPPERYPNTQIVYTAHSIPEAMSQGCKYVQQLQESCRLVSQGFPEQPWKLVYQSRSGPPAQPWLEPDICDYLRELYETKACSAVVVVPIGFVSDHMEVLFDLDTEAKQLCDRIGLNMVRAQTAGTHPTFISMIRDLMLERTGNAEKQFVGEFGPNHDVCPMDCCPSGRPLRSETPPN